jgi:hypothetical protein
MIVCPVWLSLMTREGEIGKKARAPGDSRGPGTFYPWCTKCVRAKCADQKSFNSQRPGLGLRHDPDEGNMKSYTGTGDVINDI